jgi:hypothetical protein
VWSASRSANCVVVSLTQESASIWRCVIIFTLRSPPTQESTCGAN